MTKKEPKKRSSLAWRKPDHIYHFIASLNQGSNPTRLMILRDSDGMPLATGWSRAGCEKVANTFRKLGIPCRVITAGNQHKDEPRQEALIRFNEWRKSRPS